MELSSSISIKHQHQTAFDHKNDDRFKITWLMITQHVFIVCFSVQEIKAIELEEHLTTGGDDEMELSDEDDTAPKKKLKGDDRMLVLKVS